MFYVLDAILRHICHITNRALARALCVYLARGVSALSVIYIYQENLLCFSRYNLLKHTCNRLFGIWE